MSVSVEKPTPGLYSCSFPQGGSDISIGTLRKYGLVVHLNALNSKLNGNLSVDVGYRITQVTAYSTSIFLKVQSFFFHC